jgi:hypothetical protein
MEARLQRLPGEIDEIGEISTQAKLHKICPSYVPPGITPSGTDPVKLTGPMQIKRH